LSLQTSTVAPLRETAENPKQQQEAINNVDATGAEQVKVGIRRQLMPACPLISP
jgi:hypothetical protein